MALAELMTFVVFTLGSYGIRRDVGGIPTAVKKVATSMAPVAELLALNCKTVSIVSLVLLHLLNIILYVHKYPLFGFVLLGTELGIMLWLLNVHPTAAAFRGVWNAIMSVFSFGYILVEAVEDDKRIKELQEMVNTLMEENHKLLDELTIIRKELIATRKDSNNILAFLASLGDHPAAMQVAAVVLLSLILLLTVFLVVKGVYQRRVFARRLDRGDYIELESFREGSTFVSVNSPPAVMKVVNADTEHPLGHASIVRDAAAPSMLFVLTAEHVVAGEERVKIVGPKGLQLGLPRDYVRLDEDIVVYELSKTTLLDSIREKIPFTVKDCLRLARKATSIAPATIFASGKSSQGTLMATKNFGILSYSGSTEKGFSGAPYVSGNEILGVHTAATSKTNLGVDSNLIRARLLHRLDQLKGADNSLVELEDSDTTAYVIEEVMKRAGKGIKWKKYGGDSYDVLLDGKYFAVEEEDMYEMGLLKRPDFAYTEAFDKPSTSKAVPEKFDTNPQYDDSENSKRGSVLAQAPGACQEQDSAPQPSTTVSLVEEKLSEPLKELTSVCTSLLQSTRAQQESLSRLIQQFRMQHADAQNQASAATNGPKKVYKHPQPAKTITMAAPPKGKEYVLMAKEKSV